MDRFSLRVSSRKVRRRSLASRSDIGTRGLAVYPHEFEVGIRVHDQRVAQAWSFPRACPIVLTAVREGFVRHPPDLAAHERSVPAVIPLWYPICLDCFFSRDGIEQVELSATARSIRAFVDR
jgi:hypothetical protein